MKMPNENNNPTLVAFLLDRSGSMSACQLETIKGFNGYIDGLEQDPRSKTMRFTLTQFDSQGIDIIHDAEPLVGVRPLTEKTYQPRGGTPLYDAIGKTIRATEEAAGDKYQVLFVTLTDGEENSSVEWSLSSLKDLMKQKEDKDHWTFAHIGVGVAGWDQARVVMSGLISGQNVMHGSHAGTSAQYANLTNATLRYASSAGGQTVNSVFTEKEKETE